VTEPAISVRNLRKAYRLYAHPRDMLLEALTGRRRHDEFVALDDISFDVAPGTVIGLMGRNGAGKSTLLRIIAGTLDSSGGTLATRGRIAAILELGTGFHPDYTGRENIYLGGLCLGLTREGIDNRFDEIVAFSELAAFIDQPFRTFSSGMQARLTFSVATCVDPDILIVDEALSVGDAKFQLKSFDRIRDFKRRGKAILVVSHSINQIVAFCDRAILLEKGRIHAEGDPNKIGQIYHELLFGPAQADVAAGFDSQTETPDAATVVGPEPLAHWVTDVVQEGSMLAQQQPRPETGSPPPPCESGPNPERSHRYGSGKARITSVHIVDETGRPAVVLRSGESCRFVIAFEARADLPDVQLGIIIRNAWGLDIIGTDTRFAPCPGLPQRMEPGQCCRVEITMPMWLAPGTYFLTTGVAETDETKHDMWLDCLQFEVLPGQITFFTSSLINCPLSFAASLTNPYAKTASR
jgi:lipopolysaccharide transport system ATP-binding protein